MIINTDLEKKIADAFEVFDHSGKQTVDVREIGTILRSLGIFHIKFIMEKYVHEK